MPRDPRSPEIVSTRLLTAEASASAALALIQRPALWEALTTLALLLETVQARHGEHPVTLGNELLTLIREAPITEGEAEQAVALLNSMDVATRTWAAVAHPQPRLAPAGF